MEAPPLRSAQAARRLGISTAELLRRALAGEVPYVMVDDIAHFRPEAIDEYGERDDWRGPGRGG